MCMKIEIPADFLVNPKDSPRLFTRVLLQDQPFVKHVDWNMSFQNHEESKQPQLRDEQLSMTQIWGNVNNFSPRGPLRNEQQVGTLLREAFCICALAHGGAQLGLNVFDGIDI